MKQVRRQSKKLCALLLALMMALSLAGFSQGRAYADSDPGDCAEVIASAGDTEVYHNGQPAQELLGENGTVDLTGIDGLAGLAIEGEDGAKVTVESGSVVSGDDCAIDIGGGRDTDAGLRGGDIDLTVNGDVQGTGDCAILVRHGGDVDITVKDGDVIGEGAALDLETSESISLTVENGDIVVSGGEGTVGVGFADNVESSLTLTNGSVTGGDIGVAIVNSGTTSIVVNGEIEGAQAAFLFENEEDARNTSVQVWGFGDSAHIAARLNEYGEIGETEDDPGAPEWLRDFAKSIAYIVTVVQENICAVIGAESNDPVETAHEDDVLYLRAADGYRIVSATNGVDGSKVDLSADENGNFFYRVLRGGGIWLSAILEQITQNNDPENNDPENNDPENNDPENNDPENNDPENNDPENNDPENNDPENNDPENNDPENAGPGNNDPENNDPENNNDAGGPGTDDPAPRPVPAALSTENDPAGGEPPAPSGEESGETITDSRTPLASTEASAGQDGASEEIGQSEIPLAERKVESESRGWSLSGLLSAVATVVLGAVMALGYAKEKTNPLKLAGLIPAAASVAMIAATQNFAGQMSMADAWTLPTAAMLGVNVILSAVTAKKKIKA